MAIFTSKSGKTIEAENFKEFEVLRKNAKFGVLVSVCYPVSPDPRTHQEGRISETTKNRIGEILGSEKGRTKTPPQTKIDALKQAKWHWSHAIRQLDRHIVSCKVKMFVDKPITCEVCIAKMKIERHWMNTYRVLGGRLPVC